MQFYYPNVLWMMLIPIVLLIVLIGTNKSTMQKFFNEDVLQKLSAGGNFMRSETRNFVLFAALILMTIALARPVMDLQEHESKQELIPIVVAIDVSKSMLADDIYPNRLELAKKKLKYIVQNAQNSAIGVVLFAKSSFIMSPITQDFTSLMYLIEHLDTGLNFDNGSDMMSMIETADQLTVDFSAKNIILLSDGGNKSDYSAEIIYAKEKKINIYAVALATKKGTAIPKKNGGYMTNSAGEIVVVGLNEQMSTLAMQSGGGYIDFSLGNSDIDAILNDIYSKSKKAQFESQKVKTFTELFYYPLALALLVLLIAFSSLPRKKILSALALLFVLSPSEQYAVMFDFEHINQANEAYEKSDYKSSSKHYQEVTQTAQGSYNYANSLYKEKKYEQALKQYEKVISNDQELEFKKLHNMGNSFVKLKKLKKAKEFYEKALKIHKDKQTQENLDKVNEALKKQEQKDKNKDQNKKNDKEKKDQNKKKDQDQNKDQKKQDKQSQSKDQQKDGTDQGKPKPQKDSQKIDEKNKQQDLKKDQKKKEQENKNIQNVQNSEEQNIKTISNSEEKKWLKMLNEQQTPVMLYKAKTKESNNDDNPSPW